MKAPQRTPDLRQVNTQVVLREICFNGSHSRLDLSARTGLSAGTITNVVSDLLQSGMLVETGLIESAGGRPRALLDFNPTYGYFVGVDLGETHVQLQLFDLNLRNCGSTVAAIDSAGERASQYVEVIAAGCRDLINEAGIDRSRVLGVGIGVPGIVGHNGSVTVAAPMWNWEAIPLLVLMEQRIGLPVYIDNGAKAMALAEAWFGAGRGVQDLAVVLIGHGIGSGIITKGVLYRGATNSAGEWGHTKVMLDGRPCRCGSRGCLEAYAGAPGILTTAQDLRAEPDPTPTTDARAAIVAMLAAYRAGEPVATETFKTTARILGAGLANLINLFNPELIIIGGWTGLLIGNAIMDDLTRAVRAHALPVSTKDLRISLARLGDDAICTGAACLVLDGFLAANVKFARGGSVA